MLCFNEILIDFTCTEVVGLSLFCDAEKGLICRDCLDQCEMVGVSIIYEETMVESLL